MSSPASINCRQYGATQMLASAKIGGAAFSDETGYLIPISDINLIVH